MATRGICSRREADRYIERGEVLVDGEVIATLGQRVSPNSHIELRHSAKKEQDKKVTILLNKPIGYVSTQPEKGYKAAIELIVEENQVGPGRFDPRHRKKLAVVGRLDIDSKGLLLLTQDGTLAKKIIGEDSEVEKEYLVRVDRKISDSALENLRFGLKIDGIALKKAQVERIKPDLMRMVLKQGKKRQIRRMCEQVGLKAIWLKRIRIGDFELGDLPEGKWRYFCGV